MSHSNPPPLIGPVYGRTTQLAALVETLCAPRGPVQIVLHGPAGVGKSTLARALLNQPECAAAFPDGRAWMACGDLPAQARAREHVLRQRLGALLRAFDAPSEQFPTVRTRIARLRDVLAGGRVLLVLDDVRRAEDVQAILAACTRPTRVVLTTRAPQVASDLRTLAQSVPALGRPAALELLADAGHAAAQVVELQYLECLQLAELVEDLPQGLVLVGRALQRRAQADGVDGAVAALCAALSACVRAPGLRLAQMPAGLVAALALGYAELPTVAVRRAARQLAVFGGEAFECDAEALQALWACDAVRARDWRHALSAAGFLTCVGTLGPVGLRYSVPTSVAEFAQAHLAQDATEATDAALAHARHYARVVRETDEALAEHFEARALARLDADFAQVRRAVAWASVQAEAAHKSGDDAHPAAAVLRDLIVPLRRYAHSARALHGEHDDWLARGLRVCRSRALRDQRGEAEILYAQGQVLQKHARFQQALAQYAQALTLLHAVADAHGAGLVLKSQGDVHVALRRPTEALTLYEQALATYRAAALRPSRDEADALKAQGDVAAQMGHAAQARACYAQALAIYRLVGARFGEAETLAAQGQVALTCGEDDAGDALLQKAVALYTVAGAPLGGALRTREHGVRLAELGRAERARLHLREAAQKFAALHVAELAAECEWSACRAPHALTPESPPEVLRGLVERCLPGLRAEAGKRGGRGRLVQMLNELVTLCGRMADWRGALKYAGELLALAPGIADADFWQALAVARDGVQDGPGALEAAARALALAPDNALYQRNYAYQLIGAGRLEEAELALDVAARLAPDAPHLALNRARLARARGAHAECARWAEVALAHDAQWEDARALWAWAEVGMG